MDEKLRPVGVKKMKDKFGFHKVYIYEGIEGLTYVLKTRIKQQSKQQDTVYLVSGLEGMGKSQFTLWGAEIYSEITGRQVPIENVTRHLKELFARIYNLKDQPSFLTMDEGAELDGNKAAQKEVKDTKDKFTAMRKLSHIVFICFVNPLRITNYFREDRVRGLFFVKKHGEVWFYANSDDNPHLITIIDTWRKDHDAKTLKFLTKYAPDFILRGIPDYHGYLRKPYEDRKDSNIMRVLEHGIDTEQPVDLDLNYLNLKQASQLLSMSEANIRYGIAKGILSPVKIRGRYHFKKEDLIAYRDKGIGTVKTKEGIVERLLI